MNLYPQNIYINKICSYGKSIISLNPIDIQNLRELFSYKKPLEI